LRNGGKNTVLKINGKDKAADIFVYWGSTVKKNGKIQTEIYERTGNASKSYNLARNLLQNKNVDRRCKITIFNV
jgi:hypothetical protein